MIDYRTHTLLDAIDQLRAEVERKQREIDLLWSDRRKDAALIAELRAQLAQQQCVPNGYVLVPVEPTLEMANASVYNGTDYTGSFDFDDFKKDWTDILAAAPAPANPAGQWVAVTERLPQIKQVLSEKCTLEGRDIPTLYRSGEVLTFDGKRVSAGIVEWFHAKSPLSGVTHWMPLPPAPENCHD